jgi:DNA polymerase
MYRYFPGASITKIHGQPKRVGNRLIVPMFHPAAALRNPKWRSSVVDDFNKLPQFIAKAAAFRAEEESQENDGGLDPTSAQQLSLF